MIKCRRNHIDGQMPETNTIKHNGNKAVRVRESSGDFKKSAGEFIFFSFISDSKMCENWEILNTTFTATYFLD